jgi:AbiV family abortive infection protein
MTDEEILEGVRAVSRNAKDLLEDARLLLDHGRFARGASLAVLSQEESVKAAMLLALPLAEREEPYGKRFRRAMRDHRAKSGVASSGPFLLGEVEGEGRERLSDSLSGWSDRLKQRGLYADRYEGGPGGEPRWELPSEAVPEADARAAVELAERAQVPFPEEDQRWLLQLARTSGGGLDALIRLAERLEELLPEGSAERADLGAAAGAPDRVRGFAEAEAARLSGQERAGEQPRKVREGGSKPSP